MVCLKVKHNLLFVIVVRANITLVVKVTKEKFITESLKRKVKGKMKSRQKRTVERREKRNNERYDKKKGAKGYCAKYIFKKHCDYDILTLLKN